MSAGTPKFVTSTGYTSVSKRAANRWKSAVVNPPAGFNVSDSTIDCAPIATTRAPRIWEGLHTFGADVQREDVADLCVGDGDASRHAARQRAARAERRARSAEPGGESCAVSGIEPHPVTDV